jgi:hypothetical protein
MEARQALLRKRLLSLWRPLIEQPSFLVTHGEAIFRLILVSQATFGVLTVFWWHMHYFELQDEKNGASLLRFS